MPIFGPAHVFDEVAQLIGKRCEDFVFVFYRFCAIVSALCVTERLWCVASLPSRKGISSSRVRSGPSASAIVDSLRMALSRRRTSSCCVACVR